MNFFKKLFHKKVQEPELEDQWEQLVFYRENVNFEDSQDVLRYIRECLDQMAEASRENALLGGEYNLVTGYLSDTEEIGALPKEEREQLNRIANTILQLSGEQDRLREHGSKMEDDLFYRVQSQEKEIEEGIKKLKEAEEYGALVKQDLVRLHRERSAYAFRKQELLSECDNLKGMTKIFLVAVGLCLMVILILYSVLQMDVLVGCFLAIIAAAIAITVTCIKYMDAKRELRFVNRDISKLIALQNKVKIRYANNTRLLEYLRLKYSADNSAKLQKIWNQFTKERDLRRQAGETQAKLEYYQNKLMEQLGKYPIKHPARWLQQTGAIVDTKEMVEVRHELILRRQALRKQMEYNTNVAMESKHEILDIARVYPVYAKDIMELLGQYEDAEVDF